MRRKSMPLQGQEDRPLWGSGKETLMGSQGESALTLCLPPGDVDPWGNESDSLSWGSLDLGRAGALTDALTSVTWER